MKKILLTLFFILLYSCSHQTGGEAVYGADEFVLDSYKIKEGKFSILQMQGENKEGLSMGLLDEYEDTICEGDILQIAVYHPKRQDITAAVKEIGESVGFSVIDGKITLPDLESIEVNGLTLVQAKKRVEDKYNGQIQDVEVFIGYKDRAIRKVELAGLVSSPSIMVDGKIRLFDVLSKARIPPEANLFKSYIIRENKLLAVDLYKLLKEGDMSQNIVMKGGDKVYIAEPSAAKLMVMGEVGKECVVSLPHGSMPLREALAQAGGIPYTGDKSYIQVIRGSILQPKIYVLNWQHVIHLPNDSLLLMPGDIVYVASKPITEWNRFITQLLPSFGALDMMTKGVSDVGIIIQ
ncbi:MAG: polysaccharide biosynthesis/export family protein [Chlamydiae bacterium]|nr:polysaccharide biosynthesis/export family protein [Chlamydiota bacterium]